MPRTFAMVFLLSFFGVACPANNENNATPECNAYCDLALETCLQDNAFFGSREECLTVCSSYRATGEEGDKKGDTVQCRTQHLKFAQTAPAQHCPHGGPTGAGVCVDGNDPCATYCAGVQENCAAGEAVQYDSINACEAECLNFRINGDPGDVTGNTVQCRTSFVFQPPAELTPVQSCAEAGPESMACQDPMSQPDMSTSEDMGEADMSADM